MVSHLDDILVVIGVAVVGYAVSWWSIPAAIAFVGVSLIIAGVLVGASRR